MLPVTIVHLVNWRCRILREFLLPVDLINIYGRIIISATFSRAIISLGAHVNCLCLCYGLELSLGVGVVLGFWLVSAFMAELYSMCLGTSSLQD